MALTDGNLDQILRENPGCKLIELDGHRILVTEVAGGRGYAPVDLLAAGKIDEAAAVAKKAWDRRL